MARVCPGVGQNIWERTHALKVAIKVHAVQRSEVLQSVLYVDLINPAARAHTQTWKPTLRWERVTTLFCFLRSCVLISIVKRLCVTATDRQKYYILVKSQTTGEEIIWTVIVKVYMALPDVNKYKLLTDQISQASLNLIIYMQITSDKNTIPCLNRHQSIYRITK